MLNAANLIDVTTPIRGLPFASLRDLVVYLATFGPIRYSSALDLVTNQGIIMSARKPGEKLKKSSFYHYWKALEILGFIKSSSEDKLYRLTERGHDLARLATKGAQLGFEEQITFRHAMLDSNVIWKNFLSLFTGSVTPISPLPLGNRVSFIPLPAAQLKRSKYRRVSISSPFLDTDIVLMDGRIPQVIVTGLRQWGLQCNLIDEIVPPSTSIQFRGISELMYLLDENKLQLSEEGFADIFKQYAKFGTILLETMIRFDLPELLSLMCLNEGLKLATAQRLLTSWIARTQKDVALERPSRALVENQWGSRHKSIRDPRQPWLTINGVVYTTLLAKRSLFEI